MQQARSDFGFAKALRLLNAAQYRQVFNETLVRSAHPHLLILARPNALEHPRLGLVISKKHVRKATDRNQIKRISRETFRLQQHQLPALDTVVLARPGVANLDKAALAKLLNKLWCKLAKRAHQAQQTP
ncbi:ribonuclease P protein component [Microbulbifer spongiae]|uniref:Ribonuclease P protein component n=1 Tax=Microbulbifer spongiae TaxID=2944933 RepID=A0ABY9E9Z4_9GAMM|nr:ribonuclease P protein component [Microbulbifer sp. MI-G]WKD49845.1 ribonuclease P protein component [Microbulbifer sp. MI-G]